MYAGNLVRGSSTAALAASRLALVIAALTFGSAPSAEAAKELKGSFGGGAYSTWANAKAGPVAVTLGRSAQIPCPCRGTDGKVRSSVVTDVSASPDQGATGEGEVTEADATRSTVFTRKTASTALVRNTASAEGLSLLGGAITADQVKAVARVSATKSAIEVSTEGSVLDNLVVNGNALGNIGDIPPNTERNLPGIGRVILNSVRSSGNANQKQVTVEMLVVEVTKANRFGLPVGSEIIVGHAKARFSREPATVLVGGTAYGSKANSKSGDDFQNKLGRSALIHLDCDGTDGKVRTNTGASVETSDSFSLGAAKTTATGGPTDNGAVAEMSSEVKNVNLLGGLVRAGSVEAIAKAVLKNGKRSSSTEGSRITGLKVAGVSLGDVTSANRKFTLPGLGYVVANERILPANSSGKVIANGLRIVVNRSNTFGLAVGSEIIIGHADARVAR